MFQEQPPAYPAESWARDLRYARVGQAAPEADSVWPTVVGVASTAGVALGAYHGYMRNRSIGWAIGWGLLGGMFPFITIPVSLAQGFGKRA